MPYKTEDFLNEIKILKSMAISQLKSKRKIGGGIYKARRKEKLYELGRSPSLTKLEPRRTSKLRIKGGHKKTILLSTDLANVYNPKDKKYKKVKIKTITENPSNRHFVRRNIMNKGAIIDTELGKAKITSRPGQDGTINAVLI